MSCHKASPRSRIATSRSGSSARWMVALMGTSYKECSRRARKLLHHRKSPCRNISFRQGASCFGSPLCGVGGNPLRRRDWQEAYDVKRVRIGFITPGIRHSKQQIMVIKIPSRGSSALFFPVPRRRRQSSGRRPCRGREKLRGSRCKPDAWCRRDPSAPGPVRPRRA